MKLVDAHCHLEVAEFPDLDATIDAARAAGVAHAIIVGQMLAPGDFGVARERARTRPDFLSATMGIHPHEAARARPEDLRFLEETCAAPDIVAVGEAGLDYHYDHSPREAQCRVFEHQCALAKRLGKPLVVHVRDAHADCQAILKTQGLTAGVIHCFTGGPADAEAYLALGFHLSISGIVTYKKTEALQEAVRATPLERLLVETDSPYLAPIPFRGKRNAPANVRHVAEKVAELKGVSLPELAAATTANAQRVFSLAR
ncbi:MAG: TatD family hydrolase [Myxococcaceae bacterium]